MKVINKNKKVAFATNILIFSIFGISLIANTFLLYQNSKLKKEIKKIKAQTGETTITVTGIIRTSGLSKEEKQVLGLTHSSFQVTTKWDLSEPNSVQGYFLEKEGIGQYLGKCAQIEGRIKPGWEKIKEQDFTINDKYTYHRSVVTPDKITIQEYVQCLSSKKPPLPTQHQEAIITLEGRLEHATRPAPDVVYDYQLTLTKPLYDSLNATGNPWTTEIAIVTGGIGPDVLENLVGKKVNLEGYLEWGYAETRHFVVHRTLSTK